MHLEFNETRSNFKIALEIIRVLSQLAKSHFFAFSIVKLIEGMSEPQRKYFKARKLPDLNSNTSRSDVLDYFLELINFSLNIYSVDIFQLLKNLITVSSKNQINARFNFRHEL